MALSETFWKDLFPRTCAVIPVLAITVNMDSFFEARPRPLWMVPDLALGGILRLPALEIERMLGQVLGEILETIDRLLWEPEVEWMLGRVLKGMPEMMDRLLWEPKVERMLDWVLEGMSETMDRLLWAPEIERVLGRVLEGMPETMDWLL